MIRPLLATTALVLLATAAHAQLEVPDLVRQAESERVRVIGQAAEATLAIFTPSGGGGGSGVVIAADGYALSNFHVTSMGPGLKCGMRDGKLYDAVIVGVDPTGDVSLIKLFGRDDFPHARLGDSDRVAQGDWVFAAGNPFLLANDFQPTITYGIVSGVHRYQYPSGTLLEYADCIQVDASINPGNSGGPLFNADGELVGINGRASFEKRGRVNVGVAYAISINQIKKFLGYLRSGRIVDHASLGATVTSDEEGRVVVSDILDTSDAYRRGLRYGDEVVRFAGRDVTTVNGFKNVLGTLPRGWRVPLTFRRDGTTYERWVRLSGLHREGELADRLARNQRPLTPPEDRQPDRKPRRPQLPLPGRTPQADVVTQHYEARRGFANYFFNRAETERVWQALGARVAPAGLAYEWRIEGRQPGRGAVEILVGREEASVVLPRGRFSAQFDFAQDPQALLSPPGSGGFLAALGIWQRLMIEGLDRFGELYYLGTMPLDEFPLVDVLVGTYGGVETKFFFQPEVGDLVGLEMQVDPDLDPCEIFFSDFRPVNGRFLPHHWEVRYGDATFAVIDVEQYHLPPRDAEQDPPAPQPLPADHVE